MASSFHPSLCSVVPHVPAHTLSPLLPTTALGGRYHHPHFTKNLGGTAAHKGELGPELHKLGGVLFSSHDSSVVSCENSSFSICKPLFSQFDGKFPKNKGQKLFCVNHTAFSKGFANMAAFTYKKKLKKVFLCLT